jgi:transposase
VFHIVLSYPRDPFCCYTTSMNAATWWECHSRAFAYLGGVPGSIVYDRTKMVVKRHVRPGVAVPLHPDAAAVAGHNGFTIDVLAAHRPTGKGRVERQVQIVCEHLLARIVSEGDSNRMRSSLRPSSGARRRTQPADTVEARRGKCRR